MFSKGYRPRSEGYHLAVISFVKAVYHAKFQPEILQAFDKARKRRNEALDDKADTISESQARVSSRNLRYSLTRRLNS